MSAKRFRIAFSFAGEKRDFVAKVAAILAKRFGEEEILYDKYHEAEFARCDLGIYLPDSITMNPTWSSLWSVPTTRTKEWCGLEWIAIHGMLKAGKVEKSCFAASSTLSSKASMKTLVSSSSTTKRRSKPPRSSSNASP